MDAPLLLPLLPVTLWSILRVGMPARIRGGGWLAAAVTAGGTGVAVALWSMATQVTQREEAKISAALLYDAVGAAGWGLGAAALGVVLVAGLEIGVRGWRPALGPRALGPWAAGLFGAGTLGMAARGTFALLERVSGMALVMDQRKAGIPARAVDTREIASQLFSTAGLTTVALCLGVVGILLAVAPRATPGADAPPKRA